MPWPTKKLGEICDFVFGYSFKAEDFNESGKGLPVIRIGNIDKGIAEKFYDGKYDDRYLVKKDNVLIGLSGTIKVDKWRGEKALLNQRIVKICDFNPEVLEDFVFYQLPQILKRLEIQISQGTVKNVLLPHLSNLKILIPPLSIQQKIVEKLDTIKKAQKLQGKQIELAEELFQSLLHRELNPKRKKWEIKELGEFILKFDRGVSWSRKDEVSEKEGVPVLRIPNVLQNKIISDELKYIRLPEVNENILKKDDIVMVASNGNPNLVARSALITDNEEGMCFASFLVRSRFDESKLLPQFAQLFFTTPRFKKEIQRKINTTSGIYNLKKEHVENVKISFPPIEAQRKIVEKLSAVQEYEKKLLEQKQKLKELFESVLNKSLKGEL